MASPDGISDSTVANPNPNLLDVAAAALCPPSAPMAASGGNSKSPDTSEFWILFSTLPEESQKLLKDEISKVIVTKITKVVTVLQCRIEGIFKAEIERFTALKNKEIESDVIDLMLNDFVAMLPGMIDKAISYILADHLKVKLVGVLEDRIISVFEDVCKKMFDNVKATADTLKPVQQEPILSWDLQQMDVSTSAINVLLNCTLDIVQMTTSKEKLRALLLEQRYEEVFSSLLEKNDVYLLRWLFSEVDYTILHISPLSQKTLLQLYKQLSVDIKNDTSRKLLWMERVVDSINTADSSIKEDVEMVMKEVDKCLLALSSCDTIKIEDVAHIKMIRITHYLCARGRSI